MKYIFITGMGRSGTTFLASLLKEVKNAHVGHEMIGQREFWLLSWYLSETSYTEAYLQRTKAKIESSVDKDYYIDVSPYLQYVTDDLRKTFQSEAVLHLVRHPKEVIRSLYTRRNEKEVHLLPKDKNDIQRWLDADRFEQICWNWKHAVGNLLSKNLPVIRFEDIISNYDYFNEKLLKPFGLTLSEENWSNAKNKKVNKTRGMIYRFLYSKIKGKAFQPDELPEYDSWPESYKIVFMEHCGPAMKQLGYAI